jgi:hypothetical protein
MIINFFSTGLDGEKCFSSLNCAALAAFVAKLHLHAKRTALNMNRQKP